MASPAAHQPAHQPEADQNLLVHVDQEKALPETACMTFIIFQSVISGTAAFGIANTKSIDSPTPYFWALAAATLPPTVHYFRDSINWLASHISFSSLKPSSLNDNDQMMSRERALQLLAVPPEHTEDQQFIKQQYETLIRKTTPKVDLGRSTLAIEVERAIADINAAYAILKK